MKLNKYICLIVTVAVATLTSVSSAQSGSETAIPQAVVQDAVSYPMGDTDGSMIVGETIIPAQPTFETGPEIVGEVTGSGCYEPAPAIQACDCCQEGCTRCRPVRKRSACGCKRRGCQGGCEVAAPEQMFQSCEGDFCKLSTATEKVKKSCFKTEQVPVCVPAVRLPWQKCCPPGKSRTRLVTKLKTEKTEVEACVYKWSVEEANDCGCDSEAEAVPAPAAASSEPAEAEKSDVEATIEENAVPPAPEVKGAFLRSFRKR